MSIHWRLDPSVQDRRPFLHRLFSQKPRFQRLQKWRMGLVQAFASWRGDIGRVRARFYRTNRNRKFRIFIVHRKPHSTAEVCIVCKCRTRSTFNTLQPRFSIPRNIFIVQRTSTTAFYATYTTPACTPTGTCSRSQGGCP